MTNFSTDVDPQDEDTEDEDGEKWPPRSVSAHSSLLQKDKSPTSDEASKAFPIIEDDPFISYTASADTVKANDNWIAIEDGVDKMKLDTKEEK